MQFILSMAITLTLGLTMFQCGNAKSAGNTTSAKNDKNAVTEKTNPAAQTQTPDDGAPRITLADAKADYDAGSAVIVDSRPADFYKVEHIKGAINVPLAEFEVEYKNIPTNKKIIVYCS